MAENKARIFYYIKFTINSAIVYLNPKSSKTHYRNGRILFKLDKPEKAIAAFEKAVKCDPKYTKAYVQLGKIMKIKGDSKNAIKYYQNALDTDPDCLDACVNLAELLLPGITYEKNLALLHKALQPKAYIEIGVETGKTITFVNKETIALGIDPNPQIIVPLTEKTKIFPITSDEFFEEYDVAKEMQQKEVDFAFIDGLHTFEQVLKDFINVERYARKDTVVCFHDCLPLSEFTASVDRKSSFWTGDVWKIIPCLIKYRPDLQIFTIATKPSGLGVVTNLNPKSKVLADNFDKIIAEYNSLPYSFTENDRNDVFKVIENEWSIIEQKLPQTKRPVKVA